MGDCFEKLGQLLNNKIQESEEKENIQEMKESESGSLSEGKKTSGFEKNSKNKISPELLLKVLKNKPSATVEIVRSGEYEEDVPVKIITGEAEFK